MEEHLEITISELLSLLESVGIREELHINEGLAQRDSDHARFRPEQVTVLCSHRFEGISDPDDMAIVYEVGTDDGQRAVVIDAFGVFGSSEIEDFMSAARDQRKRLH